LRRAFSATRCIRGKRIVRLSAREDKSYGKERKKERERKRTQERTRALSRNGIRYDRHDRLPATPEDPDPEYGRRES